MPDNSEKKNEVRYVKRSAPLEPVQVERKSEATGSHLAPASDAAEKKTSAARSSASASSGGRASARASSSGRTKKSPLSFFSRKEKSHDPVPVNSRPKPKPKEDPAEARPQPTRAKIRRREQRTGCLGAFMYFMFILCLSIAIAFFAWMAASDVMALNKQDFTATVTLPANTFTAETVYSTNDAGETVEKTVSHADIAYVSEALYQSGLIHYRWLFELYCSISNADVKFDPGEYELKSSYDYRALVQNMRAGAGGIKTVDVTIPEGFTMLDVFKRLEENKVNTVEAFTEAAATYNFKYDFLAEPGYEGASRLEGYLYPDTYQFYVGMEASTALNKLLNNFYYKYNADMVFQTEQLGYSVKEILTVASIIEKEAKLEDDRAYVASVIYNRLKAGMTLGMDTTILYLYQDHEGEPTREMLEEDSPYNTHIYGGLPPTPICNPGMASLTAALNPAESDYYYFYADIETGKLNFFTNYNDFNYYVETHRDS